MAKKSTGRPVGRPVGTRTATVELETVSFKAPKEFVERVKRYAKQRSRPVSELVRDGLEWRIGEGDPLNMRYGTVTSGETAYEGNIGNTDKAELGIEFLHGMLSALVEGVSQLRKSMQTIEQRLGEIGRVQAHGVTGNTITASVDGDIPAASMEAQSTSEQAPGGEDTREDIPPYDTATRVLGKLCKRGHEWGNTEKSLLSKRNNGCLKCEAEKKREREKAKKEAQLVKG